MGFSIPVNTLFRKKLLYLFTGQYERIYEVHAFRLKLFVEFTGSQVHCYLKFKICSHFFSYRLT